LSTEKPKSTDTQSRMYIVQVLDGTLEGDIVSFYYRSLKSARTKFKSEISRLEKKGIKGTRILNPSGNSTASIWESEDEYSEVVLKTNWLNL